MKWQTNPWLIQLRGLARGLGLTRVVGLLLPSRGYEAAFDKELLAAIGCGDVVWDVGANIGYYTIKFAEAAGETGNVFAFEPFPVTSIRLKERVKGIVNVKVNELALGNCSGSLMMQAGSDEIGATSKIVTSSDTAGTEIVISTGDEVVLSGIAQLPNVMKIDTEGFELDVLQGMTDLLNHEELRAIFVEVHFGLLAERGMPNAPMEIENLLIARGFNTRWVDPSHIAGVRG